MKPKYVLRVVIAIFCVAVLFAGQASSSANSDHPADPYPHGTGLMNVHFGDMQDLLSEAKAEKKILMVYFWQNGCPYCGKFEKEVLTVAKVRKTVEDGFYPVEVNLFGSKEITSFDGQVMNEKSFSDKYAIQFTPTIIYFGGEGEELFRMPGFWEEPHFMAAMAYVREGHYKKQTFQEFIRYVWFKPKEKDGGNK